MSDGNAKAKKPENEDDDGDEPMRIETRILKQLDVGEVFRIPPRSSLILNAKDGTMKLNTFVGNKMTFEKSPGEKIADEKVSEDSDDPDDDADESEEEDSEENSEENSEEESEEESGDSEESEKSEKSDGFDLDDVKAVFDEKAKKAKKEIAKKRLGSQLFTRNELYILLTVDIVFLACAAFFLWPEENDEESAINSLMEKLRNEK